MNFSLLSTKLLALSSLCLFFIGDAQQFSGNETVSALFAFGDSILDTGNNNNLNTLSKCNFFPYGRNFKGGIPTGRFGNGRVFSDIIADGLGLKELLPAYGDPLLSNNDLPTGVCFASGGSGLDERTASLQGVIWVPDQVKDFKEYITKLNNVVRSETKTNEIISNAVYLISAGNNDLAITYSTERTVYTISAYTDLMVSWTENLLKSLYDMGARKFAVLGTLPLGCLPGARHTVGNLLNICVVSVNQDAALFNQKLSAKLKNLPTTFPDKSEVPWWPSALEPRAETPAEVPLPLDQRHLVNPLLNLINNPQASGFVDVADGCCCMPTSPVPCPDASRYVFWDYGHPSEKSYKTIAPEIIEELKTKLA